METSLRELVWMGFWVWVVYLAWRSWKDWRVKRRVAQALAVPESRPLKRGE